MSERDFSSAQAATLRAAVDRIIPPDDWPCGSEAGVMRYLLGDGNRAGQLNGGDLLPFWDMYCEGLNTIEARAQSEAGLSFAALGAEAQDRVLAAIETDEEDAETRRFFRLLVEHAQEGFYADPPNGGNTGGVSWEMIGFEVRG